MKQYLIGTVDPASAKAHAGAKKAPLSAAPAGSGGAKAGGSAGIVTYALPLVLLLALFVAAKFFKVL